MGKKSRKKKHKNLKFISPNIVSTKQTPDLEKLQNNVPYRMHKASFSFEYYDEKHKKYSASSITKCKEFYHVFKHLYRLSCMTWQDIENGKNHAHDVNWKNTREKKGFPTRLQIPQVSQPYQFQLFGQFRVFGFHDRGIFNIVWFDPFHSVDSDN